METSNAARLAMLAIIFVFCWVVFIANVRNVFRFVLKKPVRRVAWVVWPVLGLFVVGCVVDTLYVEPGWVKVTHHTMETAKLPQGSNLRIVQLSDLHMSAIGQRERRMLHLTQLQQPDIIVLTGDYLNVLGEDAKYTALLEDIGRRLARIAPTYAIEGNWDSEAQMKSLSRGGVKLVKDWTMIGCARGGQVALGAVSTGCPEKIKPFYKVMLCHIPQYFQASKADWVDLALIGHTHGGQVRLPIFGALLPDQNLVGKYQLGLYEYGKGKIYVSSGVGMEGQAPEVRFCCRPEVAVFDIVGKKRR